MTTLDAKSLQLAPGGIGLMGHVIANYPSPKAARQMIAVLAASGARVVEIQIPFSEPVADGPVFLAANQDALAQGVTYQHCMDLMREMTTAHGKSVQFVFMTYLNIVYRRGYERFIQDASLAGARGVIVPDLPLEMAHATHEQKSFAALCQQYGFSHVQIIAPNTSAARIEALCTAGDGLIYAVARTGVTGAATELKPAEITSRIRAVTRLPIAVGFGIKAGEHVRLLRGHADLAIVGTETLAAYKSQGIEGVESLWKDLAAACI